MSEPPRLEAAILKCIENEPDDRFPSVDAFLKSIQGLKSEDKA